MDFTDGSITDCTAKNGGGLYLNNSGTIRMSGGSVSGCTAEQGGGLYVDNKTNVDGNKKIDNTFTMSGGGIRNNRATVKGGGIAFGTNHSKVKLNFSGRCVVWDNTLNGAHCNVQMDQDTNDVINCIGSGLQNGASIGVYVPDGTRLYTEHGAEEKPFGRFANGTCIPKLYCFVNDRNGMKGGQIANGAQNTIYWIKIFTLEVGKQLEGNAALLNTIPDTEVFTFEVVLSGKADAEGQKNANEILGDWGAMNFAAHPAHPADSVKARITLTAGDVKNGYTLQAPGLPSGLSYEVKEVLTSEQKKKFAALPETYTGKIGENNTDAAENIADRYVSRVILKNLLAVCKVTDGSGNLLYRNVTDDKGRIARVPAVYAELPEAFAGLNGLMTESGVPSAAGSIALLVDDYALSSPVNVTGNGVTLTTAGSGDTEYPFRGNRNTATVSRGGSGTASLFTVSGRLRVKDIVLDGRKDAFTAYADGGLFKVENEGTLEIESGAVLQNSFAGTTTEADGVTVVKQHEGGAVYVAAGGTVRMSGGAVKGNVSDGDGAGIYLAAGSVLRLSGSPDFGGTDMDAGGYLKGVDGNFKNGTLTGQNNGGKTYTKARQDIYLCDGLKRARLIVEGDLSGADGSIWVWAEAADMYGQLKSFAGLANGITFTGKASVFRNAREDDVTLNTGGNPILGTSEGENRNLLYWSGDQGGARLILRKIEAGTDVSLANVTFTIYRGTSATPYAVLRRNGNVSVNEQLKDLTSDATGVFWAGKLPFGTYRIEEQQVPAGFAGAGTTKSFNLTVDETGCHVADGSL